jgi:hypothetical protein
MRIKTAFAAGLLGIMPALTGCLVHKHTVLKTHAPEAVFSATLEELLDATNSRYGDLNSMLLPVQISTMTGGATQGVVKESISFKGYIIISKPEMIRVILQVPLLNSRALEMVSNGTSFKMLIPPQHCAIVGSDVSQPSQKGLYSLRPAVILDSILIKARGADQVVSMTQDSRVVANPKKRKDYIQEPDYDIEFLSQPDGPVARTLRVLHISRVNLLPYRQDIYNAEGKVATQAVYSNYQKFGGIDFPTKIVIQRPLDELGLTIVVDRAPTFNQKLEPDSFQLTIPSGTATQNMDDPVSAKSNPCVSRAPPPQH